MVWKRVCFASLVVGAGLMLAGCTGLTQGRNQAGIDTYLDDARIPDKDTGDGYCAFNGSIAADDRSDTAFTVLTASDVECSTLKTAKKGTTERFRHLWALHAGDEPRQIDVDLAATKDARILFPSGQVLLMAEENAEDTLYFLDAESWELIDTLKPGVKYHGTRTSPSRRYVAVADNSSEHADIHLIDTETRNVKIIPHEADWLEAMFTNKSDQLVVILFYDMWSDKDARARIVKWSLADAAPLQQGLTRDGVWEGADIDVTAERIDPDFMFSYTWVGISPDDHWGVFPVQEDLPESSMVGANQLLVVDLQTGDLRVVKDAHGPVGFTPDGQTMVSYRFQDTTPDDGSVTLEPALLLIDVDTLSETLVPLRMLVDPKKEAKRNTIQASVESSDMDDEQKELFERLLMGGGPSYLVTNGANKVVVGCSALDGAEEQSRPYCQKLLVYNVDAHAQKELSLPHPLTLDEFVERTTHRQLWLVGHGLYLLDYNTETVTPVALDFTPNHINYLESSDLLVLDDPARHEIVWWDPDSRKEVVRVEIPLPERFVTTR